MISPVHQAEQDPPTQINPPKVIWLRNPLGRTLGIGRIDDRHLVFAEPGLLGERLDTALLFFEGIPVDIPDLLKHLAIPIPGHQDLLDEITALNYELAQLRSADPKSIVAKPGFAEPAPSSVSRSAPADEKT